MRSWLRQRLRWDFAEADPASTTARARALTYLFIAGSLVALVTQPLTHAEGFDHVATLAVTFGTLVLGIVTLVVFDRLPGWIYAPALALATGAVTAINLLSGSGAAPYAALYIWVALYSAYFFSARATALQLVLIAVGLGVVTAGAEDAVEPATQGVVIMGSAVVVAAVVLRLKEYVGDLLARLSAAALTDELTGLGNRRRLLTDLREHIAFATHEAPVGLALFDLDGFKGYNDAFGHPAGDALLARLATRLASHVEAGKAYRLGGDEFCVLVCAGDAACLAAAERCAGALSDHGEGFAITSSWGLVLLPRETTSVVEALQHADERMYRDKGGRRTAGGEETRKLLLRVLSEQQPELHAHSRDVSDLARTVARQLGMSDADVQHVADAAELHDIGKVAVPAAILQKPGPLDPDEWTFMRRHTEIGERILATVPALEPVARIVRSSHERYDGGGYPDGLAGRRIPLGARIVAVCDAFDAMTTDRPYQRAVSADAACAELLRCAGTQFDPAVVAAFAAALGARRSA